MTVEIVTIGIEKFDEEIKDKRTHLDRPAWAYDEDGYCVSCGNGRWKFHMPGCEVVDLLDVAQEAVGAYDSLLQQGLREAVDQLRKIWREGYVLHEVLDGEG